MKIYETLENMKQERRGNRHIVPWGRKLLYTIYDRFTLSSVILQFL